MKLKGISTLEQHVEKYVLAGAAAALAGVVVWQFVDTTKVKVGSATVAPNEIFDQLKTAAQQTRSRVEDPAPKLPEVPKVNLADAFNAQLKAKVTPRERLLALGIPVTVGKAQTPMGGESVFASVIAPAPTEVRAHAFWSTIDPLEPVSAPEIEKVLPKEQPFDIPAVSVQITFDGTDFKRILDEDPDGPTGPIEPVRRAWYSALDLIGIELEREELQADGSFGNAAIVPQMPGRFSGLQVFDNKVKAAADIPAALAEVHAVGNALRPPFYNTLDGTPVWVEPALATETGEDQTAKDVKGLIEKGVQLQKQLDGINKRLKAAGGNAQGPDGRGGGGGKNGPGVAAPPKEIDKNGPMAQLERAAKNKADEIDKNRRAIEGLGFDAVTGLPLPKKADVAKAEAPLLDNKAFKAWAHDVHAEAGKVYRYRARVIYNNPYFGQGSYLKEEQRKLAENPVGRGEWSTWTGDVAVDARENYFITSAGPADALRGPRATVEMYKFFYGYPRKATVTLEPGDILAGTAKLPEGLLTFDIKKLAAVRANPADAPGGPADPRDRGPGGGGKSGGFVAPPPTDPKADTKKEDVPGTPIPRDLPIEISAMLLDAAYAVGGTSAERSLAYLKSATEQIITRSPEQDSGSPLHKRLLVQARLGDAQGKTKPTIDPNKNKPREDPVNRPPPPPPPGGGGGGGGGG